MIWPVQTIETITENLDSKRVPLNSAQRAEKEDNPLYPYVGANNILTYIDEFIFDEKILCIAEDGGSWGRLQQCAFIMDEPCWVNNHAHVLRAKEGTSLEFLKYYLNYQNLNGYISGSTRGKLTKRSLNSIKIPLPPLETQRKIAAILDTADAYRQKTKALIEKYDALAQSLFLDMFGDGNGVQTELGQVIKLVGGGTPSKDKEEYWNGNIPWASVKDLKYDRLLKTQDSISQEGVDNSATRIINAGSLIIATRMAVGRAAVCEMDVAINQDLKAVEIVGEVNTTYLLYLFKSLENYFDSVASGATVKGIKIGHITGLKINLPSLKLQNSFAGRVDTIETQKIHAQSSLSKSEELFNSLLQKAFKGELA